MTKNNAFKKTVRAYMETHSLNYAEARKILDEESYLQGTGSITLIVGRSGNGKTIALREMLKTQTLATAVLLGKPDEDIDYVRGGTAHRFAALKSSQDIQTLVEQKKYSLFAINDIDSYYYDHSDVKDYLLDLIPRRADLILTLQVGPDITDDLDKLLDYFDRMELSREKLSKRVTLIRKAYIAEPHFLSNRKNRFKVADYHL